MKRLLAAALALVVGLALLLLGLPAYLEATMPVYRDSLGDDNYTEKLSGLYLMEQSAAREDNLIIYGSSELRTLDISTHPANFFAGKRAGFQVNLIGRGSCQSLIHAVNIAASGEALAGKRVVLITSPQSYVPGGIAPDLFMANFSELQYLALMQDDGLSDELKREISARVGELTALYEAQEGPAPLDPATRWLAAHTADPTALTAARGAVLAPYYALSRRLHGMADLAAARTLLESAPETAAALPSPIDWEAEEEAALEEARRLTGNNGFGMLDDYYTTYIGSRLARQENRDAALDYSESREYGDLRLLFEACRQKGVEPLFVHVPLHGAWSDYTGFDAGRRQTYYDNVRAVAEEYGVEVLDLTGYEYEEYFLCDVMHLGWRGWLEVDRALVEFME